MFDRLDDTIVAISSPAGCGVRGIVRLSGPSAFELADRVFVAEDGLPLEKRGGFSRTMGRIDSEDGFSIQAEAYLFRHPRSYTRQNLVELHTHGSTVVLAMLQETLIEFGARPADPGEFTARAFFSGALDLTEVEGVAAMIHSNNDAQLRASEALLHGKLSIETTRIRDGLAELLSLLEAEIDFTEEPIDFVSAEQVVERMGAARDSIAELLERSISIEQLETLPEVALVGPPNAGKSTLFNRLTGVDRAIRSAVAGTTRDVIKLPLRLGEREIMLCDTAGVDWTPTDSSREEVDPTAAPAESSPGEPALNDRIRSASERIIQTAEVLLVMIPADDRPAEQIRRCKHLLMDSRAWLVVNKIDAIQSDELDNLRRSLDVDTAVICISALSGMGLDVLHRKLSALLAFDVVQRSHEQMTLSQRQRNGLQQAVQALTRACEISQMHDELSDQLEIIALEVREAMTALSLLTGEVATEDLLGMIFSRFCIGK